LKPLALITGGSAGIGLATAHSLGAGGFRVLICGRSRHRLAGARAELEEAGVEVRAWECDVTRAAQVEVLVGRLAEQDEKIDVLVNNAGDLEAFPVDRPDDAAWHRVLDANLTGPYYVTSRCVPHLRDGGRVIFISSVLGRMGVPGSSAYCAAKHGVIGFAKAVALELAPRGITVNTVCPGWTETQLARTVMERVASQMGISYEELRRQALGRVPTGRMVEPAEVAALVRFLVSPEAGNITGQAYQICGGQLMF
jgi:NAD(P)-dependent dehydrogenase (short-subunit alcohol dehydrogenase family)